MNTPVFPLLSDSPAIDNGDPAFCPATDQRGVSRPAGAGCDIGPFEAAPPFPLILQGQTNNQWRMLYGGMTGQTIQVQQSPDLVNWLALTTKTLATAGYYEVIGTNSLNSGTVFFRTFEP